MNYFGLKNYNKTFSFFYLSLILVSISSNTYANSILNTTFKTTVLSGLIKVKPEKNEPFQNLRLTKDDVENITYIITSLGEQGKLSLLVNKTELQRRGELIQGVHPLKFLTVVFKDNHLKKFCMPEILNDYFKKKNFLDGLGANMTKEAQKGKIQKYMPDFLGEINLSPKHQNNLLKFVEERNWEGFVRYIVNN